jgi:DNA polymerase III sliding clamp (beta) subunit (PCNA family)
MRKNHATIIKLLLYSCLSLCSCLSHNGKFKKNDDWIKDFKLISSSTPNPDKIVFRVHADGKLASNFLGDFLIH